MLFKEFSCYYDSRDGSITLDDITFDKKNLGRDVFVTVILTFTITSLLYLVPITLTIISCESINLKMSKKSGFVTRLFVFVTVFLLPSQVEGDKSTTKNSPQKGAKVKDNSNERVIVEQIDNMSDLYSKEILSDSGDDDGGVSSCNDNDSKKSQ